MDEQEGIRLTQEQAMQLDDLRFHWGGDGGYRIATDGETWTASPLEHPTVVLSGETPEELRLAIRGDYYRRHRPASDGGERMST
jgi:hypothetical protein